MSDTVIQVDDVWKKYRLGTIGTGTLRHDFNRWWHLMRGKPAPDLKVAENDRGTQRSASTPPDLSSDEIWALRGVSFEVKRGEILGIIGRNGAGKSTLLKILSRTTAPTSGEVRVKGRIASLLEVGTGFHPDLTGRQNVFLNGAILGMSKAEIRKNFDEIVAFSGLEKFIDTPVKRYSSGMYVRLAFAVAAHLDPEILILDEVLAVGDAEFQKKCLGKMQSVASTQGRTVIFVSHNMQAVNGLCSRVILLGGGAVEHNGEPGGAIHAYLTAESHDMARNREQIWQIPATAPGNERLRVRRLAIIPETDNTHLEIDMSTPFCVEVDYWNLTQGARIEVTMAFHSFDGSEVFEDWTLGDENRRGRSLAKGLFRTRCRVPGNLLNEGTYSVHVLFVESDSLRHIHNLKETATLVVRDLRQRQVLWHGRYKGCVHPKLTWEADVCIGQL